MSYNNNSNFGNSYDQYGSNPTSNNYEMSNVNPYAQPAQATGGGEDMIAFFGEVDDIKRNLVQFDDNVDRIESLHKRSLTEVAGENEEWIQKQIESVSQETSALGDTLKKRIKALEAKSQKDSTKKTQAENVKRQFMTSIQKYQGTEASYRQKYREVAERQFRIVRPDATDAEVKEAIEDSQGSKIFGQVLLQSNRRGEGRTALTEVQTRHKEIQKIEKTMTELAQLFHDMEVLVAEQEEPIRHIDEQAATAQHDIEAGVGQTNRAIISARSARKYRYWCALIIFIILLIIGLAVGLKVGLNN